jgi:GT2 family glycosyltransferase
MIRRRVWLLILVYVSAVMMAEQEAIWPRISIITSLYKGDEFIAGFLSDITRQTIFDQCELIIINANSPGDEEPIINAYREKFPNIVYKRLDYDPGLYGVWNMAIAMARGEFITNANVDDRRNPLSLAMHLQALEENLHVDLVYSDFYVTFKPNETFDSNTHQYAIMPDEFSPNVLYKCITGPQPMWRKSAHTKYGYFDETFASAGDFEMWNRAVSQGAKFKKVPGLSGLFYYNPKGLSTDTAHATLQQAELERINALYSYMWITHWHYFCTAADAHYFHHLLRLIGNIHELCFDRLGEIAVFDLGLNEAQKEHLQKIAKVRVYTIEPVHPQLLQPCKVSNHNKMVPGWYAWKFVVLKQALDLFPYVVWLDAGTTILKPLDQLFKYIQQSGYFLCTMGDEKFYNQLAHPISWGTTEYVKNYFSLSRPERQWILQQEPLVSGVIGVSRKALDYLVLPLYNFARHLRLFEDDGTTPNGFGTGRHDQTILSIYAYLQGLTIFQEDHTQQEPLYLPIAGKNEPFYITWNGSYVSEKTALYNSRANLYNYDHYRAAIRYR